MIEHEYRYLCSTPKLAVLLVPVYSWISATTMRSGGRTVERLTVNLVDGGSIPPTAVSKLWQFRLPHICLCL